MANNKTQNTPATQDAAATGEVHGRTHKSGNPAFEKESTGNDVSAVDQQEGAMNNGETGANLAPNEENK